MSNQFGLYCPKCGSDDGIKIGATDSSWVYLLDDGIEADEEGNWEWDDDSDARCVECNWQGKVSDLGDDLLDASTVSLEKPAGGDPIITSEEVEALQENQPRLVVIEVHGGVAYVTQRPVGVAVIIHDLDVEEVEGDE